jgi:hypothetical protein
MKNKIHLIQVKKKIEKKPNLETYKGKNIPVCLCGKKLKTLRDFLSLKPRASFSLSTKITKAKEKTFFSLLYFSPIKLCFSLWILIRSII